MSKIEQKDIDFLWTLFQAREAHVEDLIKFNPQVSQSFREIQKAERKQFLNLLSNLGKL